MPEYRTETDSLGEVQVPADKLWGAQTQRSLEHFSIGQDLIPREMITAYAILKKAAANANYVGQRLEGQRHQLIVEVCDEILAGQHHNMFPLHVWMTGSGTQFNMNVNEVISNRCCQLAGTPLAPVIGYDKASRIAHYAMDNDLTLKAAALRLGFVTPDEFDRVVDPAKMVKPYVATAK
jgi:fumarate hydratase class II